MKIISFVNKKGGVGKTNMAYNLAVELSQKHRVLIIDMDPQMDSTYTCNLLIKMKLDILDVLYNNVTLSKAVIPLNKQLSIIKGNEDVDQFSKDSSLDDLKTLLEAVADEFDYVVIDHPPTLTDASIQGIGASNQAIIVTEPERLAFKNIDAMITDLVTINSKIDIRILINKVDLRRNVTKRVLKKLIQKYPNKVFKQYISVSTAFPNANDKRIPLRNLKWWPKVLTQLRKVMKAV